MSSNASRARRIRPAGQPGSLRYGQPVGTRSGERLGLGGQLRRAVGLGGRDRLVAPEAERARVNVTRTLRATIERIAPAAPHAAAHLRASIRTGRACRYEPAPGGPARWHV